MMAFGRMSGQSLALLLLQLIAIFVNKASAVIIYQDEVCIQTLMDIVGDFEWAGEGYGSYYGMICTNPNALVTLYASADTYCTTNEQEKGLKVLQKYCVSYAEVDLTPRSALAANLTPEAVALIPVLAQTQLNETANQTAPFIPDQALYDLTFKTEDAWDYEYRTHHFYSWALYGFWGALLVVGMGQKLARVVLDKRRGYVYSDAEGQVRTASTPVIFKPYVAIMAAFRKYLLTPSALPPYHQNRFLGCTIPSRWESFIVLSYWAISIVLGAVNIHSFQGNVYWANGSTQIWRYMADRTGIMCYGNLPLLWMFAGRNNVFLWMTGWSFGTFNIYHRHIARIATLQAIMHSIGYTAFYFSEGYGSSYRLEFKEWWWTAGVLATIMMSFIVLFSFSYFRRRTYEVFLILHIVGSVLTLAFLWYHTEIFDIGDYNHPYLLPPIVIWGFDRLLRLVRQLYCNLHVSRNRGKGLLRTTTTVTYDQASNMIIMDMVPGNAKLFPGPGQHYYIYQPYRFFGWENHPFTMGYWNQEQKDGDLHLQFWIRPYDGWTKKLVRECIEKGGETKTIAPTMFIEGPYGHAEPVHTFEHVILVAGGSGIAGVLPYLLDYVRRTDKDARGPNGELIPTRTRDITLIWSDRSETYIRYIVDGVLAKLLSRHDINLQFHLTGSSVAGVASSSHNVSTASSSTEHVHANPATAESPISPVSPESPSFEKSSSDLEHDQEKGVLVADGSNTPTKKDTNRFYIQNGRPDVLGEVEKVATAIHGTEERLAVMVCGPANLSDNVRAVVASKMEPSRDSIEYFEESFGW